jgi:hypothetical protein
LPFVSATNYRTSSRIGCLSEALEQIDEQVYEPHENVEDDLEDLHDDVSRVVERPALPITSARINITTLTSNNLPTSAQLRTFAEYMTTATNRRYGSGLRLRGLDAILLR